MKKISLVLLLFVGILTSPTFAHADPIIYNFELVHLNFVDLNDPSTYTYQIGSFSLPDGAPPSHVNQDPFFSDSIYPNISYTMSMVKNGVTLSSTDYIGRLTFFSDGIELSNGFHVFDTDLPFDRNDPYHPSFRAGHYNSETEFQWYDVVAQTPEPSTLIMLTTGLVGIAGRLRRSVA